MDRISWRLKISFCTSGGACFRQLFDWMGNWLVFSVSHFYCLYGSPEGTNPTTGWVIVCPTLLTLGFCVSATWTAFRRTTWWSDCSWFESKLPTTTKMVWLPGCGRWNSWRRRKDICQEAFVASFSGDLPVGNTLNPPERAASTRPGVKGRKKRKTFQKMELWRGQPICSIEQNWFPSYFFSFTLSEVSVTEGNASLTSIMSSKNDAYAIKRSSVSLTSPRTDLGRRPFMFKQMFKMPFVE